MAYKPVSIILLGDIEEAQKYVGFAQSKIPVTSGYRHSSRASSFRKVYRVDDAEIVVQSQVNSTTIYITVEPKLEIYLQDDFNYYQIDDPFGIYYTTKVWKVKTLPSTDTGDVIVEEIISYNKSPGLWNDEITNAEVWIDCYPKDKIDIKYPHYFYSPSGDSLYTPASTWKKGDIVSNIEDFRFYDSNLNLLSFPTSHTYGFKYQPIKNRGYARYFEGEEHRYPIVYSELDRYNVDEPVSPRAIMPFTLGSTDFMGWWSGIPNFHTVGIHINGDMFVTTSRYDGTNVTYALSTFSLKENPDSPTNIQVRETMVSGHPTELEESDIYYQDPINIICTVMEGDVESVYGYITTQMESTTLWDESGETKTVNDPFIHIYLGSSWDDMVEIASWNGSSYHELDNNFMTEAYNFVAVSDSLMYVQTNTREWETGDINSNYSVLILEKINGVWSVTPMSKFSIVEPIDKEWAVIITTSYSQFYNFKTEKYHNIVDLDGNPVLLSSNSSGAILTTPNYVAVKRT